MGTALSSAQAAYDAVRSELTCPATPIPADWSAAIPSASSLAPFAVSLALSALAVATLSISRCREVVAAAPDALSAAVTAANESLNALHDRQTAVSAAVMDAAADVGVLQAKGEPEDIPGVAAAEAAIAVAELLRECTACEVALSVCVLQDAAKPSAAATGSLRLVAVHPPLFLYPWLMIPSS